MRSFIFLVLICSDRGLLSSAQWRQGQEDKVRRRTLPSVVVVDVYVATDSVLAGFFKRNHSDVQAYVAEVINGATLRYATGFDSVNVKLRLVDVYMPDNRTEQKVVTLTPFDEVDLEPTMSKLKEFAFLHSGVQDADVFLLLTARPVVNDYSTTLLKQVDGHAHVRGMCSIDKVAVAMDLPGTYLGINTTATYVAKVFGAAFTGSAECGYNEENIFNECAQKNMKHYLLGLDAQCFETTKSFVKRFEPPGLNFNEHQFCGSALPGRPDIVGCTRPQDQRNCVIRCCSPGNHTVGTFTALDGTSCIVHHLADEDKVCFNGRCDVSLQEMSRMLPEPDHLGPENDNDDDNYIYDYSAEPVMQLDNA